MKVIAYAPQYNEKHTDVLTAFADGAGGKVRWLEEYEPCDVAVIFGLVKYSFRPTWEKLAILNHHRCRSLIVIESGFTLRGQYWAIGSGGIHGNADFRADNAPDDRWGAMDVDTLPWQRREDGPVIVCGQLPRDTNVQDTDHIRWCRDTVDYYLSKDIPVLFRPHPRIKDASVYGVPEELHDRGKIWRSLETARCVVIWNSTTGVDALINGVPVIACGHGAMAAPMSSSELDLDKLRYPSRQQFFASLGYSQWTLEEMREGLPWRHLSRP